MAENRIIRCPFCGASNRVSIERISDGSAAVCGRCKRPLPTGGVMEITDSTFAREVEQAPGPVLVDMWAPWCGPCRMVAPIVEAVASDLAGRAKIAKLNVDENPRTASRFNISSIPALLIFKNGREIDRLVGVRSKAEIVSVLQRAQSSS